MSKNIVVRARKFLRNPLLERKQFVVDVFHAEAGSLKKADVRAELAKKFRTSEDLVILSGFSTKFGGGRSQGYCNIYDNKDALLKFEAKHILRRYELIAPKATTQNRRLKKENKNKGKKVRGTARALAKREEKKKNREK